MSLSDRLRRRFRGFRGRLTVELVRVEEPPPPPAPPRALPAPERPRRSAGYAALYGRRLDADPYSSRPRPLGRGPAHDKAVLRDTVNPWRTGGPAPPPPSLDLDELRAELYAPRIPWWEQREQREE